MKSEVKKAIYKKTLKKGFFLLLVIIILLLITSVPVNFNFDYVDGDIAINTTWRQIRNNAVENLNLFFTGRIFLVDMDRGTLGGMLLISSLRSFSVFTFGLLLGLLWGIPKGVMDRRKIHQKGTLKSLQKILPFSMPEILIILGIQVLATYLYTNGYSPIPHGGYRTWMNAIYPIIAISILPGAYIAKTTAESIQDQQNQPYIRVARGKGCSSFRLFRVHYLRGIILDLFGALPTILVMMFSSIVIIERMFYFPGLAYYLVEFYTNSMGNIHRAGIAFSLFIVAMGVFYFLLYQLADFLKTWVRPAKESS